MEEKTKDALTQKRKLQNFRWNFVRFSLFLRLITEEVKK